MQGVNWEGQNSAGVEMYGAYEYQPKGFPQYMAMKRRHVHGNEKENVDLLLNCAEDTVIKDSLNFLRTNYG